MTLSPGARLGAYEITALAGTGGMGEVYRARDTTLHRDVALKILPDAFVADPERVSRFEREARALAALNHPNIAAIYGLEDSGALRFLVMEFVEGESLADRLARPEGHALHQPIVKTPSVGDALQSVPRALPLAEALAIARQIVDALEAAHDKGIVHRDLKPANVMLTAEGRVKVLDFGLAKFDQGAASLSGVRGDLTHSPTLTSPAMTAAGVILGTAAYMAPEQAKGHAVDKRADIWAFGTVFYEMLTGHRMFAADSVAETIGLVCTKDPDWSALPPGTPPRIEQLLRRCLTRDPRNRLRDIGEARIAIAGNDDPARVAVAAPPTRMPKLAATLVVLAALALGAVGATLVLRRAPATSAMPLRRFELPASIAAATVGPVLSRDGSRIAFITGNHLRVQALDALQSQDLGPLPVTADNIFWSPDGQSIGFAADATIRTMPATGGPPFVVSRIPGSGVAQDVLWRRDSTIVFAVFRDGIYRVPATGGTPETFLRLDPEKEVDFHTITEVPGNRFIVTTHLREDANASFYPRGTVIDREQCELFDGKRRTVLASASNASRFVYTPPGYLLFERTDANAGVWAMPFAAQPLDLSKAVRVEAGSTRFSASDEGTLIASIRSSAPSKAELVWVDRSGAITTIPGPPIDMGQGNGQNLALSHDGRRAVFSSGASTNVVVRDLATGLDTRLTFEQHYYSTPSWFPAGDRVLYLSDAAISRTSAPSGGISILRKVMVQRADGSEPARELTDASAVPRTTPDGNGLLFVVDDAGSGRLRVAPIARDASIGQAQRVFPQNDEPNVRWFDVSRDGRLLAYVAQDPSRRLEIFVTDFPRATGRWQVRASATFAQFSPAGGELFYTRGTTTTSGEAIGQFCVVSITSTPTVTIGQETPLFDVDAGPSPNFAALGYSVAPDGRRILAARPLSAPGQSSRRVLLVQNWRAALRE